MVVEQAAMENNVHSFDVDLDGPHKLCIVGKGNNIRLYTPRSLRSRFWVLILCKFSEHCSICMSEIDTFITKRGAPVNRLLGHLVVFIFGRFSPRV